MGKYELYSKLLKGGYIGLIEGHARSLDYSYIGLDRDMGSFWAM